MIIPNFRYFATGKGIGSEFEAFFTTLRLIGKQQEHTECPEGEYDCDDATCISEELGNHSLIYSKLFHKIFYTIIVKSFFGLEMSIL